MKPIRWSKHATRELAKREIDPTEAENAIAQPDAVTPISPVRRFHQRRYFDKPLNQAMLLRVLLEETPSETVVVTLYKTSKTTKYEGGE
jgi:Domain of unknown function (DUF4258)